ncbi:unnamed protein product [Closterium sp. NIES-54]
MITTLVLSHLPLFPPLPPFSLCLFPLSSLLPLPCAALLSPYPLPITPQLPGTRVCNDWQAHRQVGRVFLWSGAAGARHSPLKSPLLPPSLSPCCSFVPLSLPPHPAPITPQVSRTRVCNEWQAHRQFRRVFLWNGAAGTRHRCVHFNLPLSPFPFPLSPPASPFPFLSCLPPHTHSYLAPEYAMSGKLTDKSDVFSFGVVLLELVTGRKPVDTTQPPGKESLVEWSRPLLASNQVDVLVDARLEGRYDEEEMERAIATAALCVRHSANLRPKMGQVVRLLEGSGSVNDMRTASAPGQSTMFNDHPFGGPTQDFDSAMYSAEMRQQYMMPHQQLQTHQSSSLTHQQSLEHQEQYGGESGYGTDSGFEGGYAGGSAVGGSAMGGSAAGGPASGRGFVPGSSRFVGQPLETIPSNPNSAEFTDRSREQY